ncbi:MAG TPA: hypothetical protein VFO49_10535 [Nocardioides sp.]|nr:hypothetical protein [Nocardioides sp.]
MTDTPEQPVAIDPEVRELIGRLDRDLNDARRHGERASRQIHKVMVQDLRAAERRAREAEKRARQAERRADRAERELAAVRESSTFRAGRAVLAVPVRIKKWRKP